MNSFLIHNALFTNNSFIPNEQWLLGQTMQTAAAIFSPSVERAYTNKERTISVYRRIVEPGIRILFAADEH